MNKEMDIYLYKGAQDVMETEKSEEFLSKQILQIFDVKNLSFLLGAGCSSYKNFLDEEIGIPTMNGLADEFYEGIGERGQETIKSILDIDIKNHNVKNNLEGLMEMLLAQKFISQRQGKECDEIYSFIYELKEYIQKKCLNENSEDSELLDLYKSFYRKLIYRDQNLPKAKVFTTNYDLYSERALDELGVLYSNGFSGFTNRFFNPATFNYAYAEQMDLSNSKWNVIDNYVYLYKLHGSINWVQCEDSAGLFNIKEIQNPKESELDRMMIYPTPSKYSASFSPPYSDLFREFQKALMKDSNALIVLGYSFSDEHINNIIYQALTIPSFRLVVFGNKGDENLKKLIALNDPRIWIVGGKIDEENLHYFKSAVNKAFPEDDEKSVSSTIEQTLEQLITNNTNDS